jgi:hypothetical protein
MDIPELPDSAGPPARKLASAGDSGVDAALTPLAGLADLPVAEHAEVYDEVHRGLQQALAGLDQA